MPLPVGELVGGGYNQVPLTHDRFAPCQLWERIIG